MATLSRQIIHQDAFIAASLQLVNLWRQAGWDLSNDPAPVPVANIVYDLMTAAGVPDGAIQMVLGPDAAPIDEPLPVECCICGEPAHHLVKVRRGYRLACDCHAEEARQAGLTVTTPPVQ